MNNVNKYTKKCTNKTYNIKIKGLFKATTILHTSV